MRQARLEINRAARGAAKLTASTLSKDSSARLNHTGSGGPIFCCETRSAEDYHVDMTWKEWNDETFSEARDRQVPVLLFVYATWCRWCRQLERDVLEDSNVREILDERFVCIKIDKDRRPDIEARFSKGGWPTLAFLDDTAELIAAENYLEVEPLRKRLNLVADYYESNRAVIQAQLRTAEAERVAALEASQVRVGPRSRTASLSLDIVDDVARTVLSTSDPKYGGWGERHKFPHPEAIDFALIRWTQTGDSEMLDLVLRTLRHMQEGEIHDTTDGGFYRYATKPDWGEPHFEKMLDSNSQRLHAYLEAYQAVGADSLRKTCESTLEWMLTTLLDEETQAFRGSQDASAEFARLKTREARAAVDAPECDPTIYTNWNAMAVSALLKASQVLGDKRYQAQALRTLDFIIEKQFDDRRGLYHYWDGAPHLPGMISDHAYTLRALIDASQYAGETRYLEVATQLANISIELLRSESGGFYDTAYDPSARGGMRRRNRSILENAVMAEALLRLSHLTRQDDYGDTAREALASFVLDYKRYGHFVAGYARAVDLLFHPPVHVTILGKRDDPRTRALSDAALKPYVASRIVQALDPEEDCELIKRCGLPELQSGDAPHAYVHRGRESYAETTDAERLPALMTRT